MATTYITGNITIPSRMVASTYPFTATGGALGSGDAAVGLGGTMFVTANGGAQGSGHALAAVARRFTTSGGVIGAGTATVAVAIFQSETATGGGIGSGAATATFLRPHISAGLTLITSALSPPTVFNHIAGRFPGPIEGNIAADGAVVQGGLTLIGSNIDVAGILYGRINADLPLLTIDVVAGQDILSIRAKLNPLTSELTALNGTQGEISAELPTPTSDFETLLGAGGDISAELPKISAFLSSLTGSNGSINASLTLSTAALDAIRGTGGSIEALLTPLAAALDAGFGAIGTIDADMTRVDAHLTAQFDASTGSWHVMVVNPITKAVSNYEQFPYNGFFELGGKYYATGSTGVVQIDVGDTDEGAPINAKIRTGLWDIESPFQKRVSGAYLVARMSGDITVTSTVDEGAKFPPSTVTLAQGGIPQLVPRRVVTARGLSGRSWQFDFNNVDGADFDFAQFGVTFEVSTRRISGALP